MILCAELVRNTSIAIKVTTPLHDGSSKLWPLLYYVWCQSSATRRVDVSNIVDILGDLVNPAKEDMVSVVTLAPHLSTIVTQLHGQSQGQPCGHSLQVSHGPTRGHSGLF